jgi:hypothetical protein
MMAPGAVAGAAVGGSVGALALLGLAWLFLLRAKGPSPKSIVKTAWRPDAATVVANPLASREWERAALTAAPREVELTAVVPAPPAALAADAALALPPGWVQCGPDADGDTWYANTIDGRVQWEPPPQA